MFVLVNTHWKPKIMTQLVTRSCNLVIQKTTQTTQKTMRNQAVWEWTALSNIVMRYCLSQTLMSNVLQYKASSEFRYLEAFNIYIIFGR